LKITLKAKKGATHLECLLC